ACSSRRAEPADQTAGPRTTVAPPQMARPLSQAAPPKAPASRVDLHTEGLMAAADEDSAAPPKAESVTGRVATRSVAPAKPRAYAGKKRKDAKAKRGRRVAPRPATASETQAPPPQWVQQGGSAPGGDFEGRAAQVNDFTETQQDALSTFAIDVDTAAYSIARRTLNSNRMP
ncbi:unnamed protein product, partial [Laminaria digitata]